MPGSVTFEGDPVPPARPSAVIAVFRYDDEEPDAKRRYQLLPNVLCLGVSSPKEGADPGSARFRYTFQDPNLEPDDPRRFEDVYPLDADGPRVVRNDDRLVVRAYRDDGEYRILFDGFAQVPQADLDDATETVSFVALGVPVREWDTPLGGALVRDADDPSAKRDRPTSLPARFNPDGHPNASPADMDGGTDEAPYPAFYGPAWPSNKLGGETVRPWDLGMAARHIIARGDPTERWVRYSDLTYLDKLLKTYAPKDPNGPIDVGDDATFTLEPVEVQDLDVTGMAWPDALMRLIDPHGLTMRFVLEQDEDGDPRWTFSVYRKDVVWGTKKVYLQEAGGLYDAGETNVGRVSLARDTNDLANQFLIDSKPVAYEASFVLAPLFDVAAGDALLLSNFVESESTPAPADADKYRVWGVDECGEGHWSFVDGSEHETPFDFGKILNDPDSPDERAFVYRRRPGLAKLVTEDDQGRPLKWFLDVSNDYAGDEPGVWDGTGTWQRVHSSEVELLDDRLGIRVKTRDPNSWAIGEAGNASPAFPGGKLSLVEQVATPGGAAGARPRFRLTCTIEADQDLDVKALARPSSPTKFTVRRHVDTRDRFRKRVISTYSANLIDPTDPVVKTDDTAEAQAHADAMRRANEAGTFAGSVTIPRLSTAYQVGDNVGSIGGRGVSLRQNIGAGAGESAVYPTVVSIEWDLDGKQTTTLHLSDRRAEPPPRRRGRDDD